MNTEQEELQRRWEYLAEAQKLSHSGIFAWNVSSGMLEWSDETYRILGFSRETNPTFDLVFDRIHPDDRDRLQKLRDRAVRDGMDLDVEHRLLMPNGDIRYLHVVAHAGHHSSGNREYIGVVSDITERKRAEEERQALSKNLQESKAWLEEAQRVAHLGYWVWDLETNQVIWSEETYRIFGLVPQAGSFDVAKVGEMIHPDDRETVFRTAEEAIRSGTRADCEHRLFRPDGEMRIVHSLGDLKKDALGRPYQMFGTTQDITEPKRAEQALQRSQFYLSEGERLAHMGSWASSDLGIRWSDDLNIYWSDEVYKIFGFDPKNGTPQLQQFLASIHPQDRASFIEAMKKMHEHHCDCDVTNRIVRPDGEIRYVRCVGVPVVEDGVFRGFHGTTMDVTQHELLTQELRREQAYLAEAQRLTHTGSWGTNLITRQVFHSSEENNRLYGFDVSQYPNPFDLHYGSILAEDELALRSKLENAIRTGADFDVEYRIRRADGAIRFLRGIGHHNPALESGVYFGITMDVTDRKRVEEEREALSNALQQSNARLEEAQRVAHIGHYEFNPLENQVTWSAELCRIWGLPPVNGPIDMAVVFEMVHPEDRERATRAVEETLRSGTYLKYEHRIVRPDGEVRFVQVLGTVKRDDSGRAYELFGTCQDITDRKRAEEALQRMSGSFQESNARLEEAQRIAHVGHWDWNLATGSLAWSDETYRIYGMAPHERPIDIAMLREMIHPEDRESMFRKAEESLLSGVPADAEHRIVRPNGEVRTVHSRADARRDASGRPYEMFGTVQDVTEGKRAEQALRRSQFYLSEGERLAHVGSWASTNLGISWGDDLGLYWSDELYRIFGLDPKNGAPGLEQCLAYVHPQDRAFIAEKVKAMHEEHCICDVTLRIVRPDGEMRYIRVVSNPVVEQGAFKGYIGTTIDVTEQELLTQELRREQAYLSDAQGMAHIGSWSYNLITQRPLHSSDENARLYGFDPTQGPISAERFFATLHAEDAPHVNATVEKAIREGTDFYLYGYRIHHTDGSIRFLQAIGRRNASGEPGEYVGITMDITERKHAEQERERLRHLEADLAHINRVNMLGELAAALAHEIKQPIAASITSANALLRWLAHDPPDLERARAAADRIEQDANRAAEVINSLQSFYKRGTPVKRAIVDLRDVIEEMAALLETEAARYSIAISAEIEEDAPKLRADRVQLQQVIMNLMLNAIEAMRDTGGELTIKTRLNPDGWLLVTISDTGVGLPEEGKDEIFNPFHSTKPQGTGMGLTITRSIVESYRGRVWGTNNHGAGATFHFMLPSEIEAHE